MKHRGAEIEAVVCAHRNESLNGLLNPGLDAFFLDVHVNVKGSPGGFERQQTGFPNGFARWQEPQMTAISQAAERGQRSRRPLDRSRGR